MESLAATIDSVDVRRVGASLMESSEILEARLLMKEGASDSVDERRQESP